MMQRNVKILPDEQDIELLENKLKKTPKIFPAKYGRKLRRFSTKSRNLHTDYVRITGLGGFHFA